MLRLHSKYGLNPTMPQCIYCGKDKGEIILLGAAYKERAPMHMIFDMEPCDECKKVIGDGVFIAESKDGKTPTGRCVGITRESFERIFNVRPVPKVCFMECEAFELVFRKEVR